ncbi:MAG: hypothetical protein QNJ14_06180 [Woeseiaceae bacterium]|nr:hypothetical protein [Woeseiaceae bacterium]
MTRFDFDWPYVRRHTLRPVLSAIVAVVALAGSLFAHDYQRERYDEITANRDAVHEDYDALVHQRRLVDRYHRRYQRFDELGFIGRESRLDWVETLRTTAKDLSLQRLSYSIEPQIEVIPPVKSVFGGEDLQIRASKLQLELGLLHELDLLRFFDALQVSAPGLIKVDRCELTWDLEPGSRTNTDTNLTATCALQLYSVITSDVGREGAY